MDRNPYRNEKGEPHLRLSIAAFVDILGYTSYTETAFKEGRGHEELIRLRKTLDATLQELRYDEPVASSPVKHFCEARSFSDNLVLGYPIHRTSEPATELLSVLSSMGLFQMEMVRAGYFVRGAISVGDLYVDSEVIFGPALLEAYNTERKRSRVPRIVLCESGIRALHRIVTERLMPNPVPALLVDSDSLSFIDYLYQTVLIAFPDDRPFTELLVEHKNAIEQKLDELARDPATRGKFEWVAHYHNFFCDRYPNLFEKSGKVDTRRLMGQHEALTFALLDQMNARPES